MRFSPPPCDDSLAPIASGIPTLEAAHTVIPMPVCALPTYDRFRIRSTHNSCISDCISTLRYALYRNCSDDKRPTAGQLGGNARPLWLTTHRGLRKPSGYRSPAALKCGSNGSPFYCAGSSNGRTPVSGSGNRGSSPCPAVAKSPAVAGLFRSRYR